MFFKKKRHSSVLAEMGLDFTFEQKCAILGSLMVFSQLNGDDIDKKKLQDIESIAMMLELKLDGTVTNKLKALKNGGLKSMFAILNLLPTSEKTWYLINVHLLSSDGEISDEELYFIKDLLKAINVTFDDYVGIVEKARQIID
jgi:hypothetical protein